MSKANSQQRGPILPRQSSHPAGRPALIPADPLPGWKALVQIAILLGIPLFLLLTARLILRIYFPQLGY